MTSFFSFLITLLQSALIIAAYFIPWPDMVTLLVVHFSPIMVFFSFLSLAIEFTGESSYWLGVGAVYCLVKYFVMWRSLAEGAPNFLNMSAMAMEVVYLAGGTFYIVYYSYL